MEIMKEREREMHFSAMRTESFINKSNKSVYIFFLGQIHQSTKFQSTCIFKIFFIYASLSFFIEVVTF